MKSSLPPIPKINYSVLHTSLGISPKVNSSRQAKYSPRNIHASKSDEQYLNKDSSSDSQEKLTVLNTREEFFMQKISLNLKELNNLSLFVDQIDHQRVINYHNLKKQMIKVTHMLKIYLQQ